MNRFDLEERLIDFSVQIIGLVTNVKNSKAGNHLSGQLIRSGTSVALNYGEARSGESKRDFIHKMQIVLKELRESHICLRIIYKSNLCSNKNQIINIIEENNQLIAIFVKSVETAKSKMVN
ncbi:MAG: four helix bundle protein [Chitinophagales bacterium]